MLEKVLAVVAVVTAQPGQTAAAGAALILGCYVVAFIGWCLWHFVEDLVDERQAQQQIRQVERAAYTEFRRRRGKDVA